MKAKFNSTCNGCGAEIRKGEEIEKTSGAYGWQHADKATCKAELEFFAEAASEGNHWAAGTWASERGYA